MRGKVRWIANSVARDLNKRCAVCDSPQNLTTHHVVPKNSGGLDSFDNYQVLCKECHTIHHSTEELRERNILESGGEKK